MTMSRVHETDSGIQGDFLVAVYDEFQCKMRDKGWIETDNIIVVYDSVFGNTEQIAHAICSVLSPHADVSCLRVGD